MLHYEYRDGVSNWIIHIGNSMRYRDRSLISDKYYRNGPLQKPVTVDMIYVIYRYDALKFEGKYFYAFFTFKFADKKDKTECIFRKV